MHRIQPQFQNQNPFPQLVCQARIKQIRKAWRPRWTTGLAWIFDRNVIKLTYMILRNLYIKIVQDGLWHKLCCPYDCQTSRRRHGDKSQAYKPTYQRSSRTKIKDRTSPKMRPNSQKTNVPWRYKYFQMIDRKVIKLTSREFSHEAYVLYTYTWRK